MKNDAIKQNKKVLVCCIAAVVFIILLLLHGNILTSISQQNEPISSSIVVEDESDSLAHIINDNEPFFTKDEITSEAYEYYSELDDYGRCGIAMACLGPETLPTEERGDIGHIQPTGWHQNKYPGVIAEDPPYLYNRCHLIAYELSGENDNEKNLITGTRAMNLAMLPYENKVAWYIKNTGNHVMYRVTPEFYGDNMLSTGVLIEAYSVEDNGEGVQFCVHISNRQPGIYISYKTGENKEATNP